MRARLFLLLAASVCVLGCSPQDERETSASGARPRDGYAGQMGVSAGDPSDYGQ